MTRAARVTKAGVAVLVAALMAGCASDGDSDSEASGGPVAEEAGRQVADGGGLAGGEEAAEQDAGGGGGGDDSLAVDTVALARREVVRTGEMDLTVDDVEAAADEIRQIAGDTEGFVADERFDAGAAESTVTVRVPAGDFDEVRDQIAELGEVVEQQVDAQDVTAEMVDLESRIGSMQASVARLQDLLGGAGDVTQLAAVEGELARREADLEALLGQQRVLQDQVDLGTLTVRLSEQDEPAPDADAAGFTDGFEEGWATAVDGGRAILAAAGFLLPFLVPLTLLAAAGWCITRTIRRLTRPAPT
jgi:hypothetical protein